MEIHQKKTAADSKTKGKKSGSTRGMLHAKLFNSSTNTQALDVIQVLDSRNFFSNFLKVNTVNDTGHIGSNKE